MHLKQKSIITALLLIVLFAGGSYADDEFSELVIFGDSLSDTGNLASVGDDFPFPFFNNRVSNGPIMVDELAELLGLEADPSLHLTGPPQGSNFAVASGKAGGTGIFDLSAQVQAFLMASSGQASPTALYLISIGGNDVRSARDTLHSWAPFPFCGKRPMPLRRISGRSSRPAPETSLSRMRLISARYRKPSSSPNNWEIRIL